MTASLYGIILLLLTIVYGSFLAVVLAGLARIRRAETAADSDGTASIGTDVPSVSILLPVRNERGSIGGCLESLARQEYDAGRYEIIVIDDASEDGTGEIVERFARGHPQIRHVRVPDGENPGGKKHLIAHGISIAAGEIVFTTDADCRHHPGWIRCMTARFTPRVSCIAGPVVYGSTNGLLSRLQALEFLGLVGVGAGCIGSGSPRICNGANLAYRKNAFESVGGYAASNGVTSGDDEYLMRKIHRGPGGVHFVAAKDAVVQTDAPATLRAFIAQRWRWASKGIRYEEPGFVCFLILLFSFFLLLTLSPILVIIRPSLIPVAAGCVCLKGMVEYVVLRSSARLLHQPFRLTDYLVAELLHPPYILVSSILGTFLPYRWKGRMLSR